MADYLNTIGPLAMPRYRPAYLAIVALLDDGQWHPVAEVAAAAQAASDLAPRTIENLIRWGHRRGRRPLDWNYRGVGASKELRLVGALADRTRVPA